MRKILKGIDAFSYNEDQSFQHIKILEVGGFDQVVMFNFTETRFLEFAVRFELVVRFNFINIRV